MKRILLLIFMIGVAWIGWELGKIDKQREEDFYARNDPSESTLKTRINRLRVQVDKNKTPSLNKLYRRGVGNKTEEYLDFENSRPSLDQQYKLSLNDTVESFKLASITPLRRSYTQKKTLQYDSSTNLTDYYYFEHLLFAFQSDLKIMLIAAKINKMKLRVNGIYEFRISEKLLLADSNLNNTTLLLSRCIFSPNTKQNRYLLLTNKKGYTEGIIDSTTIQKIWEVYEFHGTSAHNSNYYFSERNIEALELKFCSTQNAIELLSDPLPL